jgi:excisionase family DNA binding protein
MEPMNQTLDAIGTGEAAQLLGLSPSAVKKLARQGRLPELLRISGRRAFLRSDIDRFLEARRDARRREGGEAA